MSVQTELMNCQNWQDWGTARIDRNDWGDGCWRNWRVLTECAGPDIMNRTNKRDSNNQKISHLTEFPELTGTWYWQTLQHWLNRSYWQDLPTLLTATEFKWLTDETINYWQLTSVTTNLLILYFIEAEFTCWLWLKLRSINKFLPTNSVWVFPAPR